MVEGLPPVRKGLCAQMRGRRHHDRVKPDCLFSLVSGGHSRGCTSRGSERAEDSPSRRRIDRSRRANNPDNYNPDGTVKKGSWTWNTSNRGRRMAAKLAEHHRCLATTRKRDHGELVNDLCRSAARSKLRKTITDLFNAASDGRQTGGEWVSLWSISNARLKAPFAVIELNAYKLEDVRSTIRKRMRTVKPLKEGGTAGKHWHARATGRHECVSGRAMQLKKGHDRALLLRSGRLRSTVEAAAQSVSSPTLWRP